MSYVAPRASFHGADRVWGYNVDYHGASMNTSSHGPGMVPAYSEDSEILACSFAEPQSGGEGGIVCRRIPGEHDGKEWTSLLPADGALGGAAWCPTNNKFYQGTGQHQLVGSKGMIAVFDPLVDTCELISGFSPALGIAEAGRAFYVSSTDRVWVLANIGNPHRFAIVDPADNSMTMLDDINIALATDIAQTPTDLWITGVSTASIPFLPWVSRVNTSTLAVTTVLNEAIFETWLGSGVTNFGVGAIEYIPPLSQVWVAASYNSGFGAEPWLVRLNATTGGIIGVTGRSTGTAHIYYSPEFDRVLIAENLTFVSVIRVYQTDLTFLGELGDDSMTASKGCFCTSINKVALPVLTGPGGGRYYTVNFYSAADLGA